MTVAAAARRWVARYDATVRRILIAISGGADSVALAVALAETLRDRGTPPEARLVLAHFNHNIRSPDEHVADLEFVRDVGRRIMVPCVFGEAQRGSIADRAREHGGLESAARAVRYEFLAQAAVLTGAGSVCVAHTAEDQAETVLMRLLEGKTGTLLGGIPERRLLRTQVVIDRPLLDVSRADVEAYLTALGWRWMDDATNEQPEYRRNVIRHMVLPEIESHWPAVRGDLMRLARAWRERRAAIEARADLVPVDFDGSEARVERHVFFSLDRETRLELLYRVLARLGLLDRRDRPSHRFFEPVLGIDRGGRRTLVAARGIRIVARGNLVRVGRDCPPR
ncbi:MAG: tRNA lysidine(34) synthetase TilS [Spirochaetota bacterium]